MTTARDRAVLARDAVMWRLRGAACKGKNDLWNAGEALLEDARTHEEVMEAAEPLLEVCRGCPEIQACALWAKFDHYSGVAGGEVLYDGAPRVKAVPRRRQTQLAS